jgi:iron complex outermembrane receptor protein
VLDDVALRASRSIGFKPPVFSQVLPSLTPTQNTSAIDRRTGLPVTLLPTQYITGGNPQLDPEDTIATNIGLILQPRWWSGLRLSIDYVESVRDTAIASLSVQGVLDLEAADPQLAARVQRDAAGVLLFVDARNINFRQVVSKTMDITLEQRFENVFGGRLFLNMAATKNMSFKIQTSASTPLMEQIRNPLASNASVFPIQWNGNAQLRWEGSQWTLGWAARYFDYVLVRPAEFIAQGSDRLPAGYEHEAFAAYRFADAAGGRLLSGLLSDASVTLGVKNVFDREPRFQASNFVAGVYGADSIYGRSGWLQFRKGF